MPKWESLIAFRKEHGLSIEALAQQLGLPSDYVSQIENGQDDSVVRFMWKLKTVYPEIDAHMFLREMGLAWVEIKFDPKTKAVISQTPETVKIDINAIPKHQMDALCRSILNLTKRTFEDPKLVAEFEKWLPEWEAKQAAQANI